MLFLQSECEDHSDHRATYAIAHEAIHKLKNILEVRYSVWSIPFKEHKPNLFDKIIVVEITHEMEKKKEAIKLHKSQEKEGRYSKMVEDMNDYLAKLYSAYKPFELGKVEVLAITNVNDIYEKFVKDLTNVKDVTNIFHGRSIQKISA